MSDIEVIDLTDETLTVNNKTITLDSDSDTSSSDILSPPKPKIAPRMDTSSDTSFSDIFSPPKQRNSPVKDTSSDNSCADIFSPPKQRNTSKKEAREEARKKKLEQKEREQVQKEANKANAANKVLENCTATIDQNIPKFINDPEEIAIRTLFDESMVKYRLTEFPKVDNSISWTYKRTEVVDGSCVPSYKESGWIMIFIQGSDYLTKILHYKNDPTDPRSIKYFLNNIKRSTNSNIILLVYNLNSHLKSERAKEAKNYRKTFKDKFEGARPGRSEDSPSETSCPLTIGPTELQELRLMLEIEMKRDDPNWKLHFEFCEKTNDVVQLMVKYTISIAKGELKQKIKASTGIDWAINMDKERAVDPTKSSDDLTKLWITQLQQFSQVTLPIAKAIASEYPSPFALLDQYKNLTTSEAETLLAPLYVQRNLKRQIGPNISKRIYCFMTCTDPDTHIGLN